MMDSQLRMVGTSQQRHSTGAALGTQGVVARLAGLAVTIRQGHEGEWPAGTMYLGGDVVMWNSVADRKGQRLLAIAQGLDRDPDGLAHGAAATVCA